MHDARELSIQGATKTTKAQTRRSRFVVEEWSHGGRPNSAPGLGLLLGLVLLLLLLLSLLLQRALEVRMSSIDTFSVCIGELMILGQYLQCCTIAASESPRTMLIALLVLTHVDVACRVGDSPLAVLLVTFELPLVDGSIGEGVGTLAMHLVVLPPTFVDAPTVPGVGPLTVHLASRVALAFVAH